jgi:hypothetical protein
MASATFDRLKKELDAACEALRGFTLGRDGFSQKSGRDGIKRVGKLCDKLSKLPSNPAGPNPTSLIALGRGRIKAAEARLALLKKLR